MKAALLPMTTTADMTRALKDHCVPKLRDMGFKGSFPHFYRAQDDTVSLVNFQFSSGGGRFCIDLAFVDAEKQALARHFHHLEPKKLRVSMTTRLTRGDAVMGVRYRVGATPIEGGGYSDSWFVFDDRDAATPVNPIELAQSCARLFEAEADAWCDEARAFAESGAP